MSLVDRVIDAAEQDYAIGWEAIQRSVAARLRLTSSFDREVYDPHRYPTYWCVPLLVGSYVGASRTAVLQDTEAFVSGCIMRHFMFAADRPFDPSADEAAFGLIAGAYAGCRLDPDAGSSFDARFAAKCLPWTVLLAMGTSAMLDEVADRADYDAALRATVLVHSCLQMIDDHNDKAEDAARSHWNMWRDEPVGVTSSVIGPLLRGSSASVEGLRPHLLRRALDAQLRDAARDLRAVLRGLAARPAP